MKTFYIEFSGSLEQVLAFDEGRFMRSIERKMGLLFDRLQNKIVAQKLSGEVLQRRSGLLAASVSDPEIVTEGATITGVLQAAGAPAQYGIVHEMGGSRAYAIQPVDKKALRMMLGGKEVFRAMVTHPALPQRSFFYSSVEEMKNDFLEGLREAVVAGFSGD